MAWVDDDQLTAVGHDEVRYSLRDHPQMNKYISVFLASYYGYALS